MQADQQGTSASETTTTSAAPSITLKRGLILAAVGLGLWLAFGEGKEDGAGVIRGAKVKRGNVEITVVERGNLSAKNAASIRSEIEGRTTILSMVAEGTYVEEGDIVCELDMTEELNRIIEQEIQVQTAEAAFTKAGQLLEIQQLNNESEIAQAKTQVTLAGIDLKKYIEGDYPQQQKNVEEDITLGESELKQAEGQLHWSKQLHEKGFLTSMELERDELSFKRADLSLTQRRRAAELLKLFEHPRQKVQVDEDLAEAHRELKRVEKEASAELVDYQVELKTREVQLDLERLQYAKLQDQIAKGILRAPSSGMVVYGREEGHRYGRGEPVQVGADVRERQEIISIPSPGAMVAEMSLHESVLSQVSKGLPCRITVDAAPGLEFTGSIAAVSPLPDQNAWFANPNLRLFKTEVQIDEPTLDDAQAQSALRELRPGMSCSIEVFVERVTDALYVPLQCVFHKGGANVCFVRTGSGYEQRTVETGPHNTQIVVVTAGLEEGEVVLMSPPPGALTADGDEVPDVSPVPRFGDGAGPSKGGGRANPGAGAASSTSPTSGESHATEPAGEGHPRTAAGEGASKGSSQRGGRPGGGRPAGQGAGRSAGSGG